MLLDALTEAGGAEALRFGERALTYEKLWSTAAAVLRARRGRRARRGLGGPRARDLRGVVGALAAGAAVIPINRKAGERELGHIVADSQPELVLAPRGAELPHALADVARADIRPDERGGDLPPAAAAESPALIVYTSGTTGRPKAACWRAAPSRRTSTPSRAPGSGPPRTALSTACRSSTSTASSAACSVR